MKAGPRIAGVVLTSVAGGAVFGATAAATTGFAELGFIFGAAVGLVLSPIPALLLWNRELSLVLPILVLATEVATVMGMVWGGPGGGFAAAVSVFVAVSLLCSALVEAAPTCQDPGVCASCGYDVGALRGCAERCPECGASLA